MNCKCGIGCLAMVLMVLASVPTVCEANLGMVNAKSAVLLEVNNGRELWEQNPDAPIPPASITKIISLYILFEAIETGRIHPADMVEVSMRAANTGGSRMGLKVGTRVPLEEVMKGMAVGSGNDACVAAAEHLSGSVEAFVEEMNQKAKSLGMTNTTFINPNGLPAKGQFTTARDIAKLSLAYLKRFPNALELHSMKYYTYDKNVLRNRNKLLWSCPGADGIKTGFVCASGYNLSATVKRGNTRLLAVVLGAPNPGARIHETARILEEGFTMESQNDPGIAASPTTNMASLGAAGAGVVAHAGRRSRHRLTRSRGRGHGRIAAARHKCRDDDADDDDDDDDAPPVKHSKKIAKPSAAKGRGSVSSGKSAARIAYAASHDQGSKGRGKHVVKRNGKKVSM